MKTFDNDNVPDTNLLITHGTVIMNIYIILFVFQNNNVFVATRFL